MKSYNSFITYIIATTIVMELQDKTWHKPFHSIYSLFSNQGKICARNIALVALSLLQSQTANTYAIARSLSSLTDKNFNSCEKRVNRFLDSQYFQIDDNLFRCHKNFIFSALDEMNLISLDKPIFINIDFTTKQDKFLILSASIPFMNRGLPLFFSMRAYPKKAGILDQKKMELAFIKGLKHLLPKNYKYVIVADRGFCTQRFLRLCIENHFDFIIRTITNLNINFQGKKTNLKQVKKDKLDIHQVYIPSWQMNLRLITNQENDKIWKLFTSLKMEHKLIVSQYRHRFNIEKMFQDQKSSLFDIESTQIKKYSKFKKLYYIVTLAQSIMMLMGYFMEKKMPQIKKKYPLQSGIIYPLSNKFE